VEGAGFPFQVESLEDGVNDTVYAFDIDEAHHRPGAAAGWPIFEFAEPSQVGCPTLRDVRRVGISAAGTQDTFLIRSPVLCSSFTTTGAAAGPILIRK